MDYTYINSESLLERAQQSIPLGSQTFSKSYTQYPLGVSPYFAEKADGSHLWDVDGNEYVDFINSLAAITLGYNDKDVIQAVKDQLEKGTIFSLSHKLEIEVAEKIIEMVPCAEMVRFGKNGSDATAGAIRVARAFTHRDHVAVCGYHGWQDWYIASTPRNLGVPKATCELTHTFTYNDLVSLEKILKSHECAAVILEPMNIQEPNPGFLESVKQLTHKYGALLIFDETVTGFRFSNGGAQELFGVTPDLATFGKGMANGYPISAVAGKQEYMKLMEEIFFSFTFGGETLSLAAALATLTKLQKKPVIEAMRAKGEILVYKLNALIKQYELCDLFAVSGNPVWSFFVLKESDEYDVWDMKTLYLQEMFASGILTLTTHNMSYAHTDEDIAKLMYAYDCFFSKVQSISNTNSVKDMLGCESLQPLFKVR